MNLAVLHSDAYELAQNLLNAAHEQVQVCCAVQFLILATHLGDLLELGDESPSSRCCGSRKCQIQCSWDKAEARFVFTSLNFSSCRCAVTLMEQPPGAPIVPQQARRAVIHNSAGNAPVAAIKKNKAAKARAAKASAKSSDGKQTKKKKRTLKMTAPLPVEKKTEQVSLTYRCMRIMLRDSTFLQEDILDMTLPEQKVDADVTSLLSAGGECENDVDATDEPPPKRRRTESISMDSLISFFALQIG
jgi:hypothetical protein